MKNNNTYVYKSDIFNYLEKDKISLIIKESLKGLGLDEVNPFKDLVKPGQKVVIKPNLVKGNHPLGGKGVQSMITQAAVIYPIIDFVLKATNYDVKIVIADVPLQTSNWDEIIQGSGLDELVKYYSKKNIKIDLLDLRREISDKNLEGVINKRVFKDRDPLGYSAVDLGEKSQLMSVIDKNSKFRITDYSRGTVSPHHNQNINEYCICNTALAADFFINIPKLKTHRKAGLTCAMKNLIGINGDKRWLAHHRAGSPKKGGDEYKKFNFKTYFKWHIFSFLKESKFGIKIAVIIKKLYERYIIKQSMANASLDTKSDPKHFMEGSWYGNDTIWRCIIDLNNIIIFADKHGKMHDSQQRNYLCIVDGLLAGEKEGPMAHLPKKAGVVIAGFNPVSVDFTAAKIMGFDWKKIPQIYKSFSSPLISIQSNDIEINSNIKNINLNFKPSAGWQGHIEL